MQHIVQHCNLTCNTVQTLSHLQSDNSRLRKENKGLVRVVSHMVRL